MQMPTHNTHIPARPDTIPFISPDTSAMFIMMKRSLYLLTFLLASLIGVALAAPPSAPTGVCIEHAEGVDCAASPATTPPSGSTGGATIIKPQSINNPSNFHPGYYAYLGKSNGSPLQASSISAISANPDFTGIKRSYSWRSLEPTKGSYNFTVIEKDLALVQSTGKRFWITITYNEYNSNLGPDIPAYMFTDPAYGCGPTYYGAYQGNDGSWRPCLWNQNLQNKLAALYSALGARFNKEPYFEGTNLGETAINTAGAAASPGYSARGVEEGFKVIALAAKRAFPDKTVLQMINFAVFDLEGFANWMVSNEIGIGSPDMLLSNNGLLDVVFPQYLKYHDLVPTGPDVQWGNYEKINTGLGRPNTAEELLLGAIKHTNPWYIFWQNRDPYFSEDVVPAIRNYGSIPAAKQFYNSLN